MESSESQTWCIAHYPYHNSGECQVLANRLLGLMDESEWCSVSKEELESLVLGGYWAPAGKDERNNVIIEGDMMLLNNKDAVDFAIETILDNDLVSAGEVARMRVWKEDSEVLQ